MKALYSILIGLCLLIGASISEAATQSAIISWADITNETSYIIERRVCGVGVYIQVGTTLANVVTFTDANLAQGTNFGYRVTGANAIGPGIPSDEVCIVTTGTLGKVGPLNITISIQ